MGQDKAYHVIKKKNHRGRNQECARKCPKVWSSLLPAVLGGYKQALHTTHFNGTTGVQRILHQIKSSLQESREGLTIRKEGGGEKTISSEVIKMDSVSLSETDGRFMARLSSERTEP